MSALPLRCTFRRLTIFLVIIDIYHEGANVHSSHRLSADTGAALGDQEQVTRNGSPDRIRPGLDHQGKHEEQQ